MYDYADMIKKQIKLFGWGDLLFWSIILVVCIQGNIFNTLHNGESQEAIVEIAGEERYRIDLKKDRDFPLTEFRNAVILRVENGRIRMVDNYCPQKICIKTGFAKRSGDMIVCVPQKILIYIPKTSKKDQTIEIITG